MEYDLGESINNFTNWIINDTFLSYIFKNPFASSILLVIVIFIILSINYDNLFKKGPRLFKSAIYLTIAITAFLFIHYTAVKNKINMIHGGMEEKQLIDNINKMGSVDNEINIAALDTIENEATNAADIVETNKTNNVVKDGVKEEDFNINNFIPSYD